MIKQCSKLPYWEHLSETEKTYLYENAYSKTLAEKELITATDCQCMGMVYVIEGEMRVSLMSEEGREITLFRVEAKDSCVTTASCVIRQITFDTLVTASKQTTLLIIPAVVFSKLVNENIYVKAYMYEKETERFSMAMRVMQQLLFQKMDVRLAEYLLKEYEKTKDVVIRQTQEEIAQNINSAREVVARMLRKFAEEGLITVKRGSIKIEKKEELKKILH